MYTLKQHSGPVKYCITFKTTIGEILGAFSNMYLNDPQGLNTINELEQILKGSIGKPWILSLK